MYKSTTVQKYKSKKITKVQKYNKYKSTKVKKYKSTMEQGFKCIKV